MKKTAELFDEWNEKKKDIEFWWSKELIVRSGQFWRYYEWINLWNEISKDGRFLRPCVILNTKIWNGLVLICPITTKYHKWMKAVLIPILNYKSYNLKECRLIVNQIKLIDKKKI